MTDMSRKICRNYGTWFCNWITFYCSWSGLFRKWPGIFNFNPIHSYDEIIIANTITPNKIWNICYMSFILDIAALWSPCEQSSAAQKKNVPRINEGFFQVFDKSTVIACSWSNRTTRSRSIGLSGSSGKKTHMPRSDNASSGVRSSKTCFFSRYED